MKKNLTLCLLLALLSCVYADVATPYSSNPQLNSSAPAKTASAPSFKFGWYENRRDVTYIKLIQVNNGIGLSILFSSTGLFCPINRYLPFNKVTGKTNQYAYQVGNGCIATITTNPDKSTFVMTVNSRSKCFEEPTYQEFCNGNLDVNLIDEAGSTYFINKTFKYAKDQDDNHYDWNDD